MVIQSLLDSLLTLRVLSLISGAHRNANGNQRQGKWNRDSGLNFNPNDRLERKDCRYGSELTTTSAGTSGYRYEKGVKIEYNNSINDEYRLDDVWCCPGNGNVEGRCPAGGYTAKHITGHSCFKFRDSKLGFDWCCMKSRPDSHSSLCDNLNGNQNNGNRNNGNGHGNDKPSPFQQQQRCRQTCKYEWATIAAVHSYECYAMRVNTSVIEWCCPNTDPGSVIVEPREGSGDQTQCSVGWLPVPHASSTRCRQVRNGNCSRGLLFCCPPLKPKETTTTTTTQSATTSRHKYWVHSGASWW